MGEVAADEEVVALGASVEVRFQVYEVVLQKSIPAQICQLIFHYFLYDG